MSMSDCVSCWEVLCTCGFQYRNHSTEDLIKMRDLFVRLINEREAIIREYDKTLEKINANEA